MRKETIVKYEKEFISWCKGEPILMGFPIAIDNKTLTWKSVKDFNDWNAIDTAFILDNEYAIFNKALCEGKTVQYYVDGFTGWQDVTTVGNHCVIGAKNYRIKPEEPQFKVGDFVRVKSPYGQTFVSVITKFYKTNSSVILNRESVAYISDCVKWTPQAGELCWFGCSEISNHAVLSTFHSYGKHGSFRDIHSNYEYCEPFLNSKPSWFKD